MGLSSNEVWVIVGVALAGIIAIGVVSGMSSPDNSGNVMVIGTLLLVAVLTFLAVGFAR